MTPGDSFYLYSIGTVSSAGLERCLDRAEVAGSNPARFTLRNKAPTGAFFFTLLFPNKYINRCSCEVPVFPDLIFQEAFVRIFDPLRQVTEKHKRRNLTGGKLCDIFDLNIFSFPCRGWIVLDDRQHRFVQLGSRKHGADGFHTHLWLFPIPSGCAVSSTQR